MPLDSHRMSPNIDARPDLATHTNQWCQTAPYRCPRKPHPECKKNDLGDLPTDLQAEQKPTKQNYKKLVRDKTTHAPIAFA